MRLLVALLATNVVLVVPKVLAQPPSACTNRDLSGSFGFSIKGTNVALQVQYILVGQFTADGKGMFSGMGRQSVGGQATSAEYSGTYKVNPDCTGTAKFQFSGGTMANLYFVLVGDRSEVIILDSDSGTLESGYAKKETSQRTIHGK
jgi:hypothetical protein